MVTQERRIAALERQLEESKSDLDKVVDWGPSDAGRIVFAELRRASDRCTELEGELTATQANETRLIEFNKRGAVPVMHAALEFYGDGDNHKEFINPDGTSPASLVVQDEGKRARAALAQARGEEVKP